MTGLRTSAVGSRLPQNQLLGCAAARQLQRGADTISKHGMQKALTVAASPPLSMPTVGRGASSSRSSAATTQHAAPAASPRVLELQSAAELRHLLACHKGRLLVVHLVTADCPIGQVRSCQHRCCPAGQAASSLHCVHALAPRPALLLGSPTLRAHVLGSQHPTPASACPCAPVMQAFLPSLSDACRRYPAALFVRLVLQSPVASAAAAAESQELVEGLQIGRLPCTLLLRGDQLLARLDVAADQPSAAAAAAAAVTLHEAVAAALRPSVATDEQAAESEALNFSFAS